MTTANPRDMARRTFLRRSLAGAVGMAYAGRLAYSRDRQAKRPNVVFIMADDMGWADVGYHGSVIRTPNIDALARDGVRFSRHYVMPTCTPTRIGLMTGHYPSRYGVTSPAYGEIFRDDTVTLPEALRLAGYTTHISGKWHMGSPPDWTPRRYGFDSS
ncbi:MAG: sulfatase family protein, partial [Planctomycetota bacterium]